MISQPLSRRAALLSLACAGCAAVSGPDPGHSHTERSGGGRSISLVTPHGRLDVLDDGPREGQPVVLLPSLGRGAEDFDDLTRRLVASGRRVIRPQPRGIAGSQPYSVQPTLAELADDVAAAMDSLSLRACVIIGHAFGNRVARMIATRRPDRVRALILLAAGGKVAMPADLQEAVLKAFDFSLPDKERLGFIARAFFAPGNDASVWRGGWRPAVAEMQIGATERTPVDAWWLASSLPVLVVQPLQDVLAPPQNADLLKQEGGERISIAYIDRAGHALLPEQPEAVAFHVLSYLDRLETDSQPRPGG